VDGGRLLCLLGFFRMGRRGLGFSWGFRCRLLVGCGCELEGIVGILGIAGFRLRMGREGGGVLVRV